MKALSLGGFLKVVIMTDKTQRERFEEAARELECDDDDTRFDAALKKIAKAGKKPDDDKKDD